MKTSNKFSAQELLMKFSSSLVAGLLLLSVVIACRSSSSSSSSDASCTGEVTYEGRTFTGQGKNAEEAQQFACNKYCLEADPEFDAHYMASGLSRPRAKLPVARPKKRPSTKMLI
jgi:hypothetical protein